LTDIDALFAAIRARLASLPDGSDSRESLLAHIRSLARWEQEPRDYPDIGAASFPDRLPIAYAVCHPECGAREFIVEGSTQECQRCGGLLFRTATREYEFPRAAT
jgi:hypothetical protein